MNTEIKECYSESRDINQLLHQVWNLAHIHTGTSIGKKANDSLQETMELFTKLNDLYYKLYWKE